MHVAIILRPFATLLIHFVITLNSFGEMLDISNFFLFELYVFKFSNFVFDALLDLQACHSFNGDFYNIGIQRYLRGWEAFVHPRFHDLLFQLQISKAFRESGGDVSY